VESTATTQPSPQPPHNCDHSHHTTIKVNTYIKDTHTNDNTYSKSVDLRLEKDDNKYLAECIDQFQLVNPDYKSLFGNTTERKAMEAVIKMITPQQLEFILKNIVKINDLLNPYYYCTKPTEMKRNMAKIISAIKKKLEKQNKSVDIDEIIKQRNIKKA